MQFLWNILNPVSWRNYIDLFQLNQDLFLLAAYTWLGGGEVAAADKILL